MTTVGILSDTHLYEITKEFDRNVKKAFSGCDVIIHAGDLTELSILAVFKDKEVHGVCGNCCNFLTRASLPEKKTIVLKGYTFGICHGAGNRLNIEDRMYDLFPDVDCIIFGHTHIPLCKTVGQTMLINPGSFSGTGKYGASGTYAIVNINDEGLEASIKQL